MHRTAVMFVLLLALLVVPGAGAQEPTTTEPAPPVPEVPSPPTIVPDMSLERFGMVRRQVRGHVVAANVIRCRPRPPAFRYKSWQIRADRRTENLNYWRDRRARARARSSLCSPRTIARRMMLAQYGWGSSQFDALDEIIGQESGWNPCRHYPSTTNCGYGPFPSGGGSACGIPQAVPCSKLIGYFRELGQVSVREQIGWLLRYVRGRYGSPAGALAHKRAAGWY